MFCKTAIIILILDQKSFLITNKTSFFIEFFIKLPSLVNTSRQALVLLVFLIKNSLKRQYIKLYYAQHILYLNYIMIVFGLQYINEKRSILLLIANYSFKLILIYEFCQLQDFLRDLISNIIHK